MKYFLDAEFHEYEKQTRFLGGIVGEPTNTIELISIGIVSEEGREFYAICKDFDVAAAFANEWLKGNVLYDIYKDLITKVSNYEKTHFTIPDFSLKGMRMLLHRYGKSKKQIAEQLVAFIYGENNKADGMTLLETAQKYNSNHPLLNPEFYGYYCDYDWVVFCWLFGRMIDLPKSFPMYCRDLKQMLDESAERITATARLTDENKPAVTAKSIKENNPRFPKQENEHNALDDAKWNKSLWEFVETLK